ncbi:hypothetical protein [Desulfosediminicola flagellatus]|uniref:hypothetical protein n=1 Tax=Desulfosediminicola flagellatus TaxID=2569541 RepID=UPI0010AD0952|nr:hypothetical protein [Desulfosediminicola flagellatus]
MATKEDICRKIEQVIPEAGKCGIDYSVEYDKINHAWSVDLQKGGQHLKTFIEDEEAQSCLNKDKCIPVGLQIGQLKRNLGLFKHS